MYQPAGLQRETDKYMKRTTVDTTLGRTRQLLAIVAIAVASITALATASSAFAEHNYSCENCAKVSGPNENPIDSATAINYSGYGICANVWQYKGGSNYEDMGIKCTPNPQTEYETTYLGNGLRFDGHGSSEHYYNYTYHMAGHQWYY